MSETFYDTWIEKLAFLDIHYHANPDTYLRRFDALEVGRQYAALKGGVVLKNHLGGCTQMASVPAAEDLPVFGSLVLNPIAGGLSVRAVQQELCFRSPEANNRLIVHLPTQVVHKHQSVLKRDFSNASVASYSLNPEPLSTNDGRLRSEVRDLFDFAETAPVIMSSGHASRREVELLIELAGDRPNPVRLMLNQPANPMTGLSADDLIALGNYDWLFIEQTALTVTLGYQLQADFFKALLEVPNLMYSSDFGQTGQMKPDEWLRWSEYQFDKAGLSASRKKEIQLINPLRALTF